MAIPQFLKLSISLYFEILSVVVSLIFYYKKRNTIILYFIPFLLTTVCVEYFGRFFNRAEKFALYNIFTSIEFLFYVFIFNLHFKRVIFRRIAILSSLFLVIFSLINIFFIQGLLITFNTYTFLIGSFFMVLLCCFFFYESVQADSIDLQLSKQPFFWICSGLLIFYLGSVIINALFEYLVQNGFKTESAEIYKIINRTLNVILYSSFCIAFYLCPNNRKISSSPSS